MIKLVILDFDDTLCMTEEACFYLENEVVTKMGHAPMTRNTHKKNWGKPLEQAIAERVPGINTSLFMQKITKLLPSYVKKGKIDVIPEKNLLVLDQLIQKGIQIAILTSRTKHEVIHLINTAHSLHKRIAAYYHRNNSIYHKPDPKTFDQILKKFNVLPYESVYVGDSITDAIASTQAGLYFIATLESGLRSKKYFKTILVHFFIDRFENLLSQINIINRLSISSHT